jgi:hypothetical protein
LPIVAAHASAPGLGQSFAAQLHHRRGFRVIAVAVALLPIRVDPHAAPARADSARAFISTIASQPPRRLKPQARPSDTLFDSRSIEAAGTLVLDDIKSLIRQAPRLKDEITSALRNAKTTARDVVCIGRRIDGSWKYLAGARVQPYVCRIGERWLEITAELRISGASGEHYSTVNVLAAQNARYIKETNPRWTWTDIKPRDWLLD